MPTNYPLTEEFTEPSWSRYSIITGETNASSLGRTSGAIPYTWGLDSLQHIDLRTFNAASTTLIQRPENWTVIPTAVYTLGSDPSFNNWSRLAITLATGLTTLVSIADPVNCTTLGSTAILSLALPSFPLASFILATSYLDLSSDGFANTACTLPFSTNTSTLGSGDTTLTWPLSAINGVDLTHINAVRLRLNVTGTCTFYAAALRFIGPHWVQPSVDFDTWNGVLRQSIPLNGSTTTTLPSNQVLPPVWYSASTGSANDPRPINGTIGVVFNTGTNSNINSFTLNMRGVNGVDTTQLALQGATQVQLSGPQPGLTSTTEVPRTMLDMEKLNMSMAQGQSMKRLEEMDESFNLTWLSFNISWGLLSTITITNSLNARPYVWPSALVPTWAANTWYLAVFTLQDTTARVQILALNQVNFMIRMQGTLPVILFDSGEIADSYQWIRRAGRIGWQAVLNDGASQIRSIRPMSLTFAEYQSTPLNSNTPVKGARLYAHYSPSMELFQHFSVQTLPIIGVSRAPVPGPTVPGPPLPGPPIPQSPPIVQ